MNDPNAHINYSFADIERYLNGSMSAKEMHDLELAALQDPFLADAIDGYRDADRTKSDMHLNQIAAALQKEAPTQVISMPGKKRYGWLVAASLLAVIGTGILFFSKENRMSRMAEAKRTVSKQESDSSAVNIVPAKPLPDSLSAPVNSLPVTKEDDRETSARMAMLQKKKSSIITEDKDKEPILQSARAPQEAMTYPVPQQQQSSNTDLKQAQPEQPFRDSTAPGAALSEVVNASRISRKVPNANGWMTDKGKLFVLSEVEVVNIGRRAKKKADTSAIKPEGGWRSFQEYLFSRLSRNDSLSLVNDNVVTPNFELEFSLDEQGSPFNVKVIHSQDSTLSNKIVNALQNGPKWTGNDSREKRLRLQY